METQGLFHCNCFTTLHNNTHQCCNINYPTAKSSYQKLIVEICKIIKKKILSFYVVLFIMHPQCVRYSYCITVLVVLLLEHMYIRTHYHHCLIGTDIGSNSYCILTQV